uniref:Ribosomal protein L19 n=1 Tax=Glaucocystis incrassata TaxID=1789788 RepID=A0A3G1IVJ1_9EUKA|nr:ribosomal protein L19 [Glaucocystis incrassata]ASQ40065.1 ribosomal protein L19 [Glaucocystis incrassata]
MQTQSIIDKINSQSLNSNLPKISIGDTVRINLLIQEDKEKERVQAYEGIVIAMHNNKINTTITVRRILQGIGVERIFLIHSPKITKIDVLRHSKIRRAKLYYLRNQIGKATRLKQKFKTSATSTI